MTQQSHCWAYTPSKPELKKTRSSVFIAALFTIARTWKQSRCPMADEWIRKPWYIYTMEYYSAIKNCTSYCKLFLPSTPLKKYRNLVTRSLQIHSLKIHLFLCTGSIFNSCGIISCLMKISSN